MLYDTPLVGQLPGDSQAHIRQLLLERVQLSSPDSQEAAGGWQDVWAGLCGRCNVDAITGSNDVDGRDVRAGYPRSRGLTLKVVMLPKLARTNNFDIYLHIRHEASPRIDLHTRHTRSRSLCASF